MSTGIDKTFSGSIAELYQRYLVPIFFEAYAADLARRVGERSPAAVLEIAAGTGVLTRELASVLASATSIVATDLNQPMLDMAASVPMKRAVIWRQADAMRLPFDDENFDTVVCQFGVMFFPDKPTAFSEMRRVLRPGGMLFFSVWDRIETNEFARVATDAVATLFPSDPPRFFARTPHGYYDAGVIKRDLAAAGFRSTPDIVTLLQRSRADSARTVALALVQGTPLRNEIESRDPRALDDASRVVEEALTQHFGRGAIEASMQAHIVAVARN